MQARSDGVKEGDAGLGLFTLDGPIVSEGEKGNIWQVAWYS